MPTEGSPETSDFQRDIIFHTQRIRHHTGRTVSLLLTVEKVMGPLSISISLVLCGKNIFNNCVVPGVCVKMKLIK